ncbi:hypothetical protein L0B52_09200 [Suttonella sp. R2A3]|uniref:hypothetical protein n=1 Tax=Suttonella sp. R2A3 TaxID=2908648 RepID=UPI001F252320|nr:hypothetical protein [Suttonella sp. R2A3]UJF24486.1 hypothetical protein L0B52_09200 [Suttonella sp. R2A3]
MTAIEKLKSTWQYLLQRGSMVYWLGGALATFVIQFLMFNQISRALMNELQNYPNDNELLFIFNNYGSQFVLMLFLTTLVSLFVMARALDSAVRISEGDLTANHLEPVARIGWLGVLKYIAGSIIIVLMMVVLFSVVYMLSRVLVGILGSTITGVLMMGVMIIGIAAVFYMIYASMLVFIEQRSISAMISPAQWRAKVGVLGKNEFIKMILLVFAVSIVAGVVQNLWSTITAGSLLLTMLMSAVLNNYLLMFGVVYAGFFASANAEKVDEGLKAQNARLLYNADTRDLSAEEKQVFVQALKSADGARAERRFAEAFAFLAPYVGHDDRAAAYFPAYERLYAWYQVAGESQKYHALQANIIHLAAQGRERFYQLVDEDLFVIAQEHNARIPADDVSGLVDMALAHNQPDTVLALAKDFRKRQPDHPQLVKIYASVVKALQLKGQDDVAKQLADRLLAEFSNHPDSHIVQALKDSF